MFYTPAAKGAFNRSLITLESVQTVECRPGLRSSIHESHTGVFSRQCRQCVCVSEHRWDVTPGLHRSQRPQRRLFHRHVCSSVDGANRLILKTAKTQKGAPCVAAFSLRWPRRWFSTREQRGFSVGSFPPPSGGATVRDRFLSLCCLTTRKDHPNGQRVDTSPSKRRSHRA